MVTGLFRIEVPEVNEDVIEIRALQEIIKIKDQK